MADFCIDLTDITANCGDDDNGGLYQLKLTKFSNLATLEVDGTSKLVDVLSFTTPGDVVTIDLEADDATNMETIESDKADNPLSAPSFYTTTINGRVKGYSQATATALDALRCSCPLVAIAYMNNGDRFLIGVQPTGSATFAKSYPRPLFGSQAANVAFGSFSAKISTTFKLVCVDNKAPLRLDPAVTA